mmetsp:Transcript_38953/g.93741  ORF Transcript_38953/g.93741 Transcript_38953/m.93741 type:complete len:84 (-) Transcript_38953:915-1166(-)
MNPGFHTQYFNMIQARTLFLRVFDCIEAFAGKADLFRVALLYREGGWYSDWKQVCLVPNLLNEMSLSGYRLVVTASSKRRGKC